MDPTKRQQLISDYVDRILENMSTKDLMRVVGDQLEEDLNQHSDTELTELINDHYPDLLD